MANTSTTELDLLKSVTTSGGATDTINVVGTVSLSSGSVDIGKVDQGTGGVSAWKVDGSAVTQPVSGAISFSAPQHVIADASSAVIGHVIVDTAPTTAVTQSGTWTVQPGNTANTTAWKVDGSAVTQPVSGTVTANAGSGTFTVSGTVTANAGTGTLQVSAASLPLPSGASTSALQTTGNTSLSSIDSKITAVNTGAVTFASPQHVIADASSAVIGHVIVDTAPTTAVTQSGTWTVQPGNTANTTAWKVDGSAVTQPISYANQDLSQGSTTSGQVGPLVQTATTTNAPTYVTAKTNPVSSDTSGNIRVSLKDSPANTNKFLVTADPITFASAQAVTQSGTWNVGLSSGSNVIGHVIVDTAPTTAVTQSGTWTVQPGNTANTTAWKVDGSAVTQPVSGAITFSAPQHVIADASSAVIGHVIVDTAPSTAVTNAGTFAVQATLAAETIKVIGTVNIASSQTVGLSSGSAVVGKVGIDQTTPGTTNLVQVGGSLPAGSAVIGHVIVDTAPTTAVTQSGTWTVQPGNTANTTAWKVDGSAVTQPVSGTFYQTTQPVSISSLPLPTNAHQEVNGNADTTTTLLQVLIAETRKTNMLLCEMNNKDYSTIDSSTLMLDTVFN